MKSQSLKTVIPLIILGLLPAACGESLNGQCQKVGAIIDDATGQWMTLRGTSISFSKGSKVITEFEEALQQFQSVVDATQSYCDGGTAPSELTSEPTSAIRQATGNHPR